MILSHALRAVLKETVPSNFPQFQSSTTASKASGATLTITKPSGVVAGDLLIAVLVANASGGWNLLSGWTRLNNIVIDPSTSIQFRIADGTEGASFAFLGGSARGSGTVMRFTGAGNPYIGAANSSATNTTPQIAPSITVAHNESLVLNIFTSDAAGTTWTGVDGTATVSFSTECSFNIGRTEVNAGATAADTATPNNAVGYASLQLAIPPASAPTPSLSFITSAGSSTDATSYTFSSVSLGSASSGRLLIVAVGSNGSAGASVSSLTIDGNATTLTQGAAGASTVAFAVLQNDNLTSADIVVNHSATRSAGCGIAVYAITNPISTSVLDSDLLAGTGTATTLIVNDLTVTYSGFALACLSKGSTAAVTWTNATSNADVTGVSPRTFHFASVSTTASSTLYDITASWTGSTSARIGGISLN